MKTNSQFNLISIGLILSIFISVNSHAQINWDKFEWNPVITSSPGNWNESVYSPVVIFEESIFKMWFFTYYSGNYNVGYTESDDGINWELAELVIPSGQPGEWDRWKSPRTILRINDTLKMWFHATPNSTDIYSIGYAWSVNENAWNCYPEPVLEIGPAGSWDESLVYNPSVYFDGEFYHMWYSGSMNNAMYDQVGYAWSEDGINWIKDELYNNPVIALGDPGSFYDTWVQAGPVIFHNGIYQMWFGGYDGNQFEIGFATSPDKINWTVQNDEQPVVSVGLPGYWDDEAIHQPAVIIHDGIYKMWYGGWGDVNQIGYAEGDSVITSVHDITMDMDVNLRIFPNPIAQYTKISFFLSSDNYTELYIYNSVGKKIKVITSENLSAGKHEIVLNGSGLKKGIYFCTLKTNDGMLTKKIIKL